MSFCFSWGWSHPTLHQHTSLALPAWQLFMPHMELIQTRASEPDERLCLYRGLEPTPLTLKHLMRCVVFLLDIFFFIITSKHKKKCNFYRLKHLFVKGWTHVLPRACYMPLWTRWIMQAEGWKVHLLSNRERSIEGEINCICWESEISQFTQTHRGS